MVTVPEAARRWQVSAQVLRKRLALGTLQGRKIGRDWAIAEAEMVRVYGPANDEKGGIIMGICERAALWDAMTEGSDEPWPCNYGELEGTPAQTSLVITHREVQYYLCWGCRIIIRDHIRDLAPEDAAEFEGLI